MRIRMLSAALVSVSMIAAPVMAAPSSASKLSVARAAPADGESKLEGGAAVGLAIAAGIAAIAIVGAVVASDDDNPVSR